MKIVADSSCNYLTLPGVDFVSVPMIIQTEQKEYIDDENLDVPAFAAELNAYKGKSSTACPAVERWAEAFRTGDEIFVFPISSGVSGSYNSAVQACRIVLEETPAKKIHVFDSKTAGAENMLLIRRTVELMQAGRAFEEIAEAVEEYSRHTDLFFALESLHHFAQNGRISKAAAAAADLLGIRVIGCPSEKGELTLLTKCRGAKKTIATMVDEMQKRGYCGGRVEIGDTCNPEGAQTLAGAIREKFPQAEITFHAMRGLCSYYAQMGGVLMGFETN